MRKALASIRRRLDAVPLWAVGLLNLGVVAAWFVDFRFIDPLPFLDEIAITGVLAASALYTWRRAFGPPTALAAEKRRRLAEVELLYEEIRKAAGAAGVGSDVERLAELLEGIRKVEARIEQAELVLATPQYSVPAAAAEVARLKAEAGSAVGAAKADLEAALTEAERHADNIARVRGTRDELSAAFERVFQIVRRIHSQVIGLGLSQGTRDDVASSVDELAKTIDEYERDRRSLEDAERLVDQELEADRRRRQALESKS